MTIFPAGRVARLRSDADLTVAEAAEFACMTTERWAQLESGEAEPRLVEWAAIANTVGRSMTRLTEETLPEDRLVTTYRLAEGAKPEDVDQDEVARCKKQLTMMVEVDDWLREISVGVHHAAAHM